MKLEHALFVSGLLLVAACGDDETSGSEAESEAEAEAEAESESEGEGEPNLDCVGNNPVDPPTTTMITVSGTVVDGLSGKPVEGMVVEAFDAADVAVPGSQQTTKADGAYSVTATIDSNGFTGYLRASKDLYWTSEVYALTRPLTTDLTDFDINAVDNDTVAVQGILLGITIDDGLGLVVIVVEDCDGTSLPGVVADMTLAYEVLVYLADSGAPSSSLTETGTFGTAILGNVALGTGTASATLDSATYGSADLVVRPRTFSQTNIAPD